MDLEYPIGDEYHSDLSSAVSLSAAPEHTAIVDVQAISQNVRFRINTAPTASTGGVIFAGYTHRFPWGKVGIEKVQFIQEAGGAGLHAIYLRS